MWQQGSKRSPPRENSQQIAINNLRRGEPEAGLWDGGLITPCSACNKSRSQSKSQPYAQGSCGKAGQDRQELPAALRRTRSPAEATMGDRCQPFPGDGRGQEQFQASSCVGKEQKTLLYLAATSESPPEEGHLPRVPL